MSDLVAFLRARLDEDERVALAAAEESRTWTRQSHCDYSVPNLPIDDHTLWFGDRIVGEVGFGDGEMRPAEAEHIARHDPARVLAEVDAKRRIVDRCEHYQTYEDYGWALADEVLSLLALPYADHPDYREEWRP